MRNALLYRMTLKDEGEVDIWRSRDQVLLNAPIIAQARASRWPDFPVVTRCREMRTAMSNARFDDPAVFPHVFELSNNGSASVLEATAVAAGSIRETGRRIAVVADIGGGTSDFGAFMTGLRGKDVLAEIRESSRVLREAGDHLDMLLI